MKFAILICLTLLHIIGVFGLGKKCPNLTQTKNVSYREILGDWTLTASSPNLNEKCKNYTFSVTSDMDYKLHEEYYHKRFFFWWHSKNNYNVERKLISPMIHLKNQNFPFSTSSYTLLDGDYSKYIMLYKCSSYFFYIKETYEILTRNQLMYSAQNLPDSIIKTLAHYSLQSEDLTYRRKGDCNH